ncbi:MAG: hypothetical protein HGB28_05260 [Oscillochloris sp.]|nr:hypothetical protein [Oscillochloris sp.]
MLRGTQMYEQLMCELAGYMGSEGLSPSELLGLPDGLRRIVTWLTRRGGADLADLACEVGCDGPAAAALAEALVARGLISVDAERICRARLAGRRSRGLGSDRLRDLY